jgi:hypothetical protein
MIVCTSCRPMSWRQALATGQYIHEKSFSRVGVKLGVNASELME